MAAKEISFSINRYDADGYKFEDGVYFNIDDFSFKVCDSTDDLKDVLTNIKDIVWEITGDEV